MQIRLLFILAFLAACTQLSPDEVPQSEDEIAGEAELLAAEQGITQDEASNLVGEATRTLRRSYSTIAYDGCTDTDGGRNAEQQGTVTVTYTYSGSQKTRTYTDRCWGTNSVIEYYCSGDRMSKTWVSCPAECERGACLPEAVPEQPDKITDIAVTGLDVTTHYPNISVSDGVADVGKPLTLDAEITNMGTATVEDLAFGFSCGEVGGGEGVTSSGFLLEPFEKMTESLECIYSGSGRFRPNFTASVDGDIDSSNNGMSAEVYSVNPDENNFIRKRDYFALGQAFLLRYAGAEPLNSASPTATFKNVASGSTFEVATTSNLTFVGTIKLGGVAYGFAVAGAATNASDYDIVVDLDGDGIIGKGNQTDKNDSAVIA